jgi:hypothetical protein
MAWHRIITAMLITTAMLDARGSSRQAVLSNYCQRHSRNSRLSFFVLPTVVAMTS